jgi:hypothetical protein
VHTIVRSIDNTDIIWVWVAYTMAADTLHNTTIKAVELFEVAHVVVCAIVDRTSLRTHTLVFFVSSQINLRVL